VACEAYQGSNSRPWRSATPLSACGGITDDDEVPAWQVEAWCAQAAGEFRVVMFRGGHFFINESRDEVLAELSRDLRGVLALLGAYPAHA
jgi:surfactin synthase thioesterase subunit